MQKLLANLAMIANVGATQAGSSRSCCKALIMQSRPLCNARQESLSMDSEPETYCWAEGTRVHILRGDRCACLMPSANMTSFAADFPFGFGLKECESCRIIFTSNRKAELPVKRKKTTAKQKFKAYTRRLERDIKRKDALDGANPLRAEVRLGFYETPAWRKARYEALRKNDGRCELCGASKHDGAVLHVDHIKPRSRFPDLALVLSNLQVLCDNCNLGKSNTDKTDWRKREMKP
jgi:HNH endonuclease